MSGGHGRVFEQTPEVVGEIAVRPADGFAAGHAFRLSVFRDDYDGRRGLGRSARSACR
jgi:hypothetical protein